MHKSDRSTAEYYHNETKYSPETINQQAHQLDWESQPVPFKEYDSSECVDLSSFIPLSLNPFSGSPLKRSSCWTQDEKPLADLSRILYFANGITAIVPYPPNPLLMRAAPSAGGLYPNEIYVIARGYPSIQDGLYNYQVKTQSLCCLAKGSKIFSELEKICFDNSALKNCDLAVVITGVFWRSVWRYGDRAYRRILLDAGHIVGNFQLVSYLHGRKTYPIGGFNDRELNSLLMLDDDEKCLTVLALPQKEQSKNISLIDTPNALPSNNNQVKATEAPEGKKINLLHSKSEIISKPSDEEVRVSAALLKQYLSEPQDSSLQNFLQGESLNNRAIEWDACSLMTTILKRRSTRKFDPGVEMTKGQLSQILQFAYNPEDFKEQGFDEKPVFISPELLKSYLIVNNVEGLDPGCYLYQPEQKLMRQVRFKELKKESHYLCLGQELGRDASVLLFHTCNLKKAVEIYGDRIYRYLHLDAGAIGQRVNLAAVKLGLGASGIGGFFDDLGNEALGMAPDDVIIYITTLGVPFEDMEELY